jgi:hypothetical protein
MEIPDYRWADLSPSVEDKRDQPEEPRKKDDHACDAMRYGVMSRARPKAERKLREPEIAQRAAYAGLLDKRF